MCGIAGVVVSSTAQHLRCVISAMTGALAHRGPDGQGLWCDAEMGIGLGHRRLAILDLTDEGKQPMISAGGRFVTVFNGEVYNFELLRRELTRYGHRFRGHSDTEVMLAAYEEWGVEAAVKRFNGMFAAAVWDRCSHVLHLIRDRLGVKPLYYGWAGKTFLFASELKAFEAYPGFGADIDLQALCLYLRRSYVPTPYCIYRGIHKLTQGCILSLSAAELQRKPEHFSPFPEGNPAERRPKRYWALGPQRNPPAEMSSAEETEEQLHALLCDAIKLRMRADVPLGAFLSGGIDSSLVVALMQEQSREAVHTFSIGYQEERYNEAPHAKRVAEILRTQHIELLVTPAEALSVVPSLASLWDEPFADCSQIPTALLARLTRKWVTVSLSGDGGDELFGGYNRYLWPGRWGAMLWRTPYAWRSAAARALNAPRQEHWDAAFSALAPALPRRLRFTLPGNKIAKLVQLLESRDEASAYTRITSTWGDPQLPLRSGGHEPLLIGEDFRAAVSGCHPVERLMYWDMHTYLPDDVMTKVDRASMASGLEAREPLLDYRLVEYAWQVPLHFKIRNGRGKWILRRMLERHLPAQLINRPKMGFAVPIDEWLRADLRPWAEDLLSPQRLRAGGIFDEQMVRRKWKEHLGRERNWQFPLWNVLMLQAWLQRTARTV